jgi:hypothetical protein
MLRTDGRAVAEVALNPLAQHVLTRPANLPITARAVDLADIHPTRPVPLQA